MSYTEVKNNQMDLLSKDSITSLELCKQINVFREQEGRSELAHYTLLRTIEDEFEEEIAENKIVCSEYKDKSGKANTMYILTLSEAKQVLVREHKTVRKAVIKYIEVLEEQLKQIQMPQLTQEERMLVDIALSKDKAHQMSLVAEYGTIKWDNGYAVGHKEGYQEGYIECGATKYYNTTQIVELINKRAGGSFNGHKLISSELFEWLEYLGWGVYKLPSEDAGKRRFYTNKEFREVLLEDKLGQVNIIGNRHEIKWTEKWANIVGLENIGGWLKNRNAKDFK